jgi:hypothetical protein
MHSAWLRYGTGGFRRNVLAKKKLAALSVETRVLFARRGWDLA